MYNLLNKIKGALIRWKLKRIAKKWIEETENWKKTDWKDFQEERFEGLKLSSWTLRLFPDVQNYSYDELINYPPVNYYPSVPPDFKAAIRVSSTGTVKQKIISYTRNDVLWIARSVGRLLHLSFETLPNDLSLLIHSGPPYASWAYTHMSKNLVRKLIDIEVKDPESLIGQLNLAKKFGPYDAIGGSQAYLVMLIENLGKDVHKIFRNDTVVVTGGDVLYDSIIAYFKARLSDLGIDRVYIDDFYGASEVPVIGIIPERYYVREKYEHLFMPESAVQILVKEDGTKVNLFDAKPGDSGKLLSTLLFDLMIPNYNLKDIIYVTGRDPKTGLPTFKVLGREMYKVTIEHPLIGVVKGYTGTMFKLLAAPMNTFAFDSLMARFKTRYLLLIFIKKGKVIFELYTEKPIEEKFLVKQFQYDPLLKPLYQIYISGLLEIEIKKIDLSYTKFILNRKLTGQPKIPRVLLVSKIKELGTLLYH